MGHFSTTRNTGEATFDLKLAMRHKQNAAMPGERLRLAARTSLATVIQGTCGLVKQDWWPSSSQEWKQVNHVHAVDRWDHRLSECGSVCCPRCFTKCGTERQQHRHVIPSSAKVLHQHVHSGSDVCHSLAAASYAKTTPMNSKL